VTKTTRRRLTAVSFFLFSKSWRFYLYTARSPPAPVLEGIKVYLQKLLSEGEAIPDCGASVAYSACRQFEHRNALPDKRCHAVGLHLFDDPAYFSLPIYIDDVDGKSHKERVHGLARGDEQALTWQKTFAPQQSFQTGQRSVGNFYTIREDESPGFIIDSQSASTHFFKGGKNLVERELMHSLRNLAKDLGADLFGVAQLNPARSLLGDELVDQFPRAVSLAVRLPGTLVEQVRYGKRGLLTYVHHIYHTVNPMLDRCALVVAKAIEQAHFRALPIPASHTLDTDHLLGFMSHKCAAHLAGLGWIGPSCLLVTPEHGPRVRLATVLTDAPLDTGTPIEDRCGECDLCVKICPVSAFTGRRFSASEPREARFDASACSEFSRKRRSQWNVSHGSICGLCVWVCPFGRPEE